MRLIGTYTSPFVRRVRVVALELGLELEMIDAKTPEGEAAWHRATPLRKVPVLERFDEVVLDSHAIVDLLLAEHGPGPLRPWRPSNRVVEGNMVHVVDGALEAAIRGFYVRRDGGDPAQIPYMRVEAVRVERTLTWLDGQVHGHWCTPEPGFGLAELALVTALEWMQVRGGVELAAYRNLVAFAAAHAGRPSLASTRPPPA